MVEVCAVMATQETSVPDRSIVTGVPWSGPAQIQQHGQELYRRGDYDKAVEVFTQVIPT